ncbi:MAG TPA: error-prone DNA polymerase [Gemmatimonadales bacterium]|jgi:error-prone DNA polymerase
MVGLTELRCHSAYSFGDGAVSPERLVERAAALGYTSLGLTDTADLGGIVRFGSACARHGVAPVVGAELVVDGRPLAVLARSKTGYNNLAALVTRSRSSELLGPDASRPDRGRPRLSSDDLLPRSDGLQLLTGPTSGILATLVRDDRRFEAIRLLHQWREQFGGHVAVEVHWHQTGSDELALADALIALAGKARVPWFVAQDPRYIDYGSRMVHEMLTALRQKITFDELTRRGLGHSNGGWQLLDPDTLRTRWRERDAGLAESAAIAATCAFEMQWIRPPLPTFDVEPGHDDDSYLRVCALAGARERWGDTLSRVQQEQLDRELEVIRGLGFAGFFLVMWDAVREGRRLGILCQGRGSAANSAVVYCLGITAIDPVANGLLFERFLSPARTNGMTEAPDIDVDFEHDRREEILDYMYARYHRSGSAITGVTQIYSAPTALQDGMRALGLPAELAFKLSKRLHHSSAQHGAERLVKEIGPRFSFDTTTPRAKVLLTIMRACEELPRMRSTHPGGFVLSSEPLGNYAPVEWTTMGRSIIQFDKDDLDEVGIPKFDFLGLGGLAVVRRAFDAIEAETGDRPEMYRIPIDDRPTYQMISRGDTLGTFQIESRAQISSIVLTRPEQLYDITVQVALIRPGPIQGKFVRPYTDRRRGREPVTYADPRLEPILKRTQGIPIFQEQAMAIAINLAGYTPTEADMLRRTMGNQRKEAKLTAALVELRERLVEAKLSPEVAAQIESDLRGFANYGFPESHAWSFALIAYATAWLKQNHPTAFYFGLLNSQPMGFYSVGTLLQDARRHGVPLLPPCLRDGERHCTIEAAAAGELPPLRIGWRFARGLGDRQLDALDAAQQAARFTSIADVVQRGALDRSATVALARAGAFAAWEPDRRRAAWEALRAAGDTMPLAPARDTEFMPKPMSGRHRRLLDYFANGYCLDGHPMQDLREQLQKWGVEDSITVQQRRNRDTVVVCGLIIARQRPQTAKGTIFLLLEDEHGHINVIVPVSVTGKDRDAMLSAIVIMVQGRVDKSSDDAIQQIVGERFQELQVAGLTQTSRDFH